MMIFLRWKRSAATPPSSTNTKIDAVWSAPMTPIAAGESVSSYTCHGSATTMTPSPRYEIVRPVQ